MTPEAYRETGTGGQPSAEQLSEAVNEMPEYSTTYSWYVVVVLMIMGVFSYLDRQIIVMLIDPIRHDLNISDVQISLLTGFAFALFFAVCGLPIGWACDRYSRKWLILVSVLFWGLATAACGLARNFWQLFAGRMGVGIGEATLFPASYSIASDIFPPKKLTFALSVMAVGTPIGMGLGYLIAGLLASWVSHTNMVSIPVLGEVRAWQVAFLLVGLPGPLLALLMLTIKEPKRTGSIKQATNPSHQTMSFVQFLRSHWQLFTCHVVGFGCFTMGAYATFTWGPSVLLRVFGWSGAETGSVFGIVVALGVSFANLIAGTVVTYFYNRGMKDAHIRIYVYTAIVCAPIVLLAYATHNPWIFIAGIFFVLVVQNGYAIAGFAAMQIVAPNEFRARMTALIMFSSTLLGFGLGPLFVAMLTDYVFKDDKMVGWSLGTALIVIYPIGALLFWNAARYMRKMHAEQAAGKL